MIEIREQCKKCFHLQVCANVLKQQLYIREELFGEEDPKCEHFIPAADVAEVRHGEWVIVFRSKSAFVYECSECGHLELGTSDYCVCGAKMDGKVDGE